MLSFLPMLEVTLSKSQSQFFLSEAKSVGLVTGVGGGKTFVTALRILDLLERYPMVPQLYCAPNYPLIRDIFYPVITNICEQANFIYKINKQEHKIYIKNYAPIICKSLEDPELLVGFECGDVALDEYDLLPQKKAVIARHKAMARARFKYPDGRPNRLAITTTPEGYRETYRFFVKHPSPDKELIKGSTRDNLANLPADYVETLSSNYTDELQAAYIDGEFINLQSGQVYKSYDRLLNNTSRAVMPQDVLYVGVDFNVLFGAAVICVRDSEGFYAVDEIINSYDTDQTIATLKQRYPNHRINIYPDSTGKKRTSNNTSESDIAKLKAAGFRVKANDSNPRIKDRVASVNVQLCNSQGHRYLRVNLDNCPVLADALEQQAYNKDGEPDKSENLDHILDGLGYVVHYLYPIRSRKPRTMHVVGSY